jgi:hypothetical protein
MVFDFVPYGPFDVEVDRPQSEFWAASRELRALGAQTGCYIFALQSPKGRIAPAYVGLTRRRFDGEVFNPSNVRKYARAQRAKKSHRPVIFLVVHPHRKGKTNGKYIGELETFLIQAGSAENPDIQNTKGVSRPKWRVRGVTGRDPGKPTSAARLLRKCLAIR